MTDLYAAGFAEGERQAWKDRPALVRRGRPESFRGEFHRGWWDGYTPRDMAWRLRAVPRKAWHERTEATA